MFWRSCDAAVCVRVVQARRGSCKECGPIFKTLNEAVQKIARINFTRTVLLVKLANKTTKEVGRDSDTFIL